MDKEIVANFENLYRSYKKVKSGKKFNSGTARFSNLSLEGIHLLKEQLESQTYTINPYNKFQIHEPKERTIESCAFKDKVVQRCKNHMLHGNCIKLCHSIDLDIERRMQ